MQTMGQKDVKTAMKYQHPELDIVRTALIGIDGLEADRGVRTALLMAIPAFFVSAWWKTVEARG
jgi:hypothetical protein